MRKFLIGLVAIIAIGYLGIKLYWPENWVVNAPMANSLFGWGVEAPPENQLAKRIRLPEGFSINVFAEDLGNARFMRMTSAGDILLSTPRSGEIKLIERDSDGDGRSDGTKVLVEGLSRPHGLDVLNGNLYVGEDNAIARVAFNAHRRDISGEVERIATGIPSGGNHWTRTLRFGPDGMIYLHVGSSCNVCIEEDPRRAAILRFAPDGSGEEIYASGLRNTVGFAWHPETGELYGTDNGRDLLGDDFPPCELNRIVQGGFYGWPFRNGNNVVDPDFGETPDPRVNAAIPPAHAFGAHTAPLGMTFLAHPDTPVSYRNAALVAQHGSWNRSTKIGYQIVSLHWDEEGQITQRPFATGFELDEDVIGRPVDVIQGPDGAIYISDDYAGAIYRVTYGSAYDFAAPAPPTTSAGASARETAGEIANAIDPQSAEMGKTLFSQLDCASCHDATRPPPPGMIVKELNDLAARHDKTSLAQLLDVPPPPMPLFDLSEPERLALAAYLLDTYP